MNKNENEALETEVEASGDDVTVNNPVEETDEVTDEVTENTVTIEISGEDNKPSEKEPEKKKTIVELIDYLEIFVFAICFVILLYSFGVRLCTVTGKSMESTLFANDKLIVSNLGYKPERGDIIVFHQTGDLEEPVVKRVIATAGEIVNVRYVVNDISPGKIEEMIITITKLDGTTTVLNEPYVQYVGTSYTTMPITVTIGEGQIFVLGDNRNLSADSRDPRIELVDERRVLGKVLVRVGPISEFGTVK